ncbi:MAG: DUF5009 domain-containing protein [Parabacteroides sp.]|nr:DUF5009 domain-containing protein [Parabacteroides sp.]
MEKQERLRSLDALRGFDMFFIMGGEAVVIGLDAVFPVPFFNVLAQQMHHVKWDEFACYDMIFPLFLFIAGISFPFSLAKQREKGRRERAIYGNIIRRGLVLVVLGLIYNGLLNLDFANQRYGSVLGRIGLAWMFGALLFMYTKTVTRIGITFLILVGYWLLLAVVPAPDGNGAGCFTMEGCLVGYIDRMCMPGRLHLTVHDPEGLLSTLPAIATALLGMFTGQFVRLSRPGLTPARKALYLALAGIVLVIIGKVWSFTFPLNKNLWTSSFVCFVGGWSALLFALFYYIIDVKGIRKWTFFFTVIGMNSITIYMAQRIFDFGYTSDFLFGGLANLIPGNARMLVSACGFVAVSWLFLYFLYRKNIFLKV